MRFAKFFRVYFKYWSFLSHLYSLAQLYSLEEICIIPYAETGIPTGNTSRPEFIFQQMVQFQHPGEEIQASFLDPGLGPKFFGAKSVDAYLPKSQKIFEYSGCKFHGNQTLLVKISEKNIHHLFFIFH